MNFGFKQQNTGLLINNLFFPVSEQALAYLSSLEGAEKVAMLHEQVQRVKSTLTPTQTPLLQYLAHQEMPYEVMKSFFVDHFKTAKGLTTSLVQKANDGTVANITRQNRATLTVESRSPGQKSRPQKITINRPIIKSIDDVSSMMFDGANEFEQHSAGRADPLSPGLYADDMYLRNSKHSDVFDDKQIVGHRRATALYALAHGLQHDDVNFRAERPVEGHVFLPFDFAKRPDLALEVALMRYAPSWFTKSVTGKSSYSLLDADTFLAQKTGFTTNDYNRAIRTGQGFVSSLVSERFFPSGAAYMLHSFIEHNLNAGRTFAGMASLFDGTDNHTVAPRFVLPTKTGPSPLEVYIVGDDRVPGPAVLYANFESKLLDLKHKSIRALSDPLISKLNPSKEWCESHRYTPKLFSMTDRLGRVGVCVLYRASEQILKQAAHFAQLSDSSYNERTLFTRYTQRLSDAKKSA